MEKEHHNSTRPDPHLPITRTSTFIVRWLIVGLVVATAIATGIYTGNAFSLSFSSSVSPETLTNSSFLDIGDEFPDYALMDVSTGSLDSISKLSANQPTLLIFASRTCGVCEYMFRYWEHKVVPELRSDIQILAVYDNSGADASDAPRIQEHLPTARIMVTDRDSQSRDDGMFQTPTIVALNSKRQIELICTGFDRRMTAEFLNGVLQ